MTFGKPLDVLGFKGARIEETREFANLLQSISDTLYAPDRTRIERTNCPCCGAETSRAPEAFRVYGVTYLCCWQCGHGFIRSQPLPEDIARVWMETGEYSEPYTDQESLELRLAQVVKSKLDWVMQTYRKQYGRELASALDVGAGDGHFVEVCAGEGLKADGYEISPASRRFSKTAFDIDLRSDDFLSRDGEHEEFDVITFWGLLEYAPEPGLFLEAARRRLGSHQGMLVLEVPRFDCLGAAIQIEFPETVVRYAGPTMVNMFTDASLAATLYVSGFKPVAAWYFGLDVYELLTQMALKTGQEEMVDRLAYLIPGLQAALDSARLGDDIVVAAVPLE